MRHKSLLLISYPVCGVSLIAAQMDQGRKTLIDDGKHGTLSVCISAVKSSSTGHVCCTSQQCSTGLPVDFNHLLFLPEITENYGALTSISSVINQYGTGEKRGQRRGADLLSGRQGTEGLREGWKEVSRRIKRILSCSSAPTCLWSGPTTHLGTDSCDPCPSPA